MKNKLFLTAFLILLNTGGILNAQSQGPDLKLSLKEAQSYAIEHNKMVITSKMDVETSRIALKEMVANTLPQIDASGNFNDNLKLMTTLIPAEFFGGQPGEFFPVKFGTQFNSGATAQASLLLFNAPVYIGIESSKLAIKLSEQSLTKSELDTKEAVAQAYYLILISEKSLTILDSNIANLKETLKSTQGYVPGRYG